MKNIYIKNRLEKQNMATYKGGEEWESIKLVSRTM